MLFGASRLFEGCANKRPLKSMAEELTRRRVERLGLSPLLQRFSFA
jgi:hypothetical protein